MIGPMYVIGLMSGTSLDGIDVVLVDLEHDDEAIRLRVVGFMMQPFTPALAQDIRAVLPPQTGSTAAVCALNVALGQAFARAAQALLDQVGLAPAAADLAVSHGQTVFHQVAPGEIRSSLQLGTAAEIAEQIGCTVVADLRP